jgi:hypothetical protein
LRRGSAPAVRRSSRQKPIRRAARSDLRAASAGGDGHLPTGHAAVQGGDPRTGLVQPLCPRGRSRRLSERSARQGRRLSPTRQLSRSRRHRRSAATRTVPAPSATASAGRRGAGNDSPPTPLYPALQPGCRRRVWFYICAIIWKIVASTLDSPRFPRSDHTLNLLLMRCREPDAGTPFGAARRPFSGSCDAVAPWPPGRPWRAA